MPQMAAMAGAGGSRPAAVSQKQNSLHLSFCFLVSKRIHEKTNLWHGILLGQRVWETLVIEIKNGKQTMEMFSTEPHCSKCQVKVLSPSVYSVFFATPLSTFTFQLESSYTEDQS